MQTLKEKAKTPSELTAWMFQKYLERKDSKWVRLEDVEEECQKCNYREVVRIRKEKARKLKQKLQQFKFDVEEELKVLGDEVDRGCWNPLNVWDLLFAIKTFVDKKFEELLE